MNCIVTFNTLVIKKKVLLFLDFYMFNANLPNKVDFDERMLSVSFNNNSQYTSGSVVILSSWDALKSSFETIKLQNSIFTTSI